VIDFVKNIKKNLDKWAALVIAFYLIFLFFKYPSYKDNRSIIHDVTSYYGYLPAAFIYDDIDFGFADTMPPGEPLDALWYNALPNGQRFQKMTMGLSYFYAPSFFLADIYVKYNPKYHRNGFSKPYQWAMGLNTLLIGLMSVFLMRLILRYFFTSMVAALALVLVFSATNFTYYISLAPGLSHPYSFFLLCLQFLLVLQIKDKPHPFYFIFIGLVTAWLVLIRPTNLLPALLPLFLFSKDELFTFKKPALLLLLILGAAVPWIPQLMYWKHVSGQLLFYSYDTERFFFNDPKVADGLFGFRKGWFIYTPVMIAGIIGLFFKNNNDIITRLKWFIAATLPLYLFVVFSWWCWWYGGSYGSRVMIEYYVVFAVFIGVVIRYFLQKKTSIKVLVVVIAMGFIGLTKSQLHQYSVGLLHWDSMTWPAYRAIFLNSKLPANYEKLLVTPDYEKAKKGMRD
jgi:hypothetical protein